MIPAKTDPRWKDLVTGKAQHEFRFVPAGLLMARVLREASKDSSPAALEKYIDEVHSLFVKYEKLLKDDVSRIFG